jgi:outer membrane protein OmpA-like peptidoglycan-associated protein
MFAQNDFILTGTISNAKTKIPVDQSVYVIIKYNYKELYRTYCNISGKYSINVSDTLNGKEIVLSTSQDEKKINVKVTEESCGYKCLDNLEYMNSSERKRITLKADSTKKYVVNFILTPLLRCGSPPTIYFNRNELTMAQSDWYKTADSALCDMAGFMKCRPTMTIELSGNCSPDERNKDTLSLKRAQIVKEQLVSMGINPQRIFVMGHSDKNYHDYKKGHEKNERLITKYEGQAVYISQLSNDFGVQTKTNNDDE